MSTISNVRWTILCLAAPTLLSAQAAVEAAAGAGRAATTTAPAQKMGKGIAGAFDSLNRALESVGTPKAASGNTTSPADSPKRSAAASPASPVVKPASEAPKPKAPDVVYEDPSGIEAGMTSAEVARRFGAPALSLTTGPGQETLCYAGKAGSVDVTVVEGKVTAVRKAGAPEKAGAVTIQ